MVDDVAAPEKSGRCGSAAKRSPHRSGISRTLGLRARSDGVFIVTQTASRKKRHEIGYLLGYQHTAFGLMSPTLATGVRETPMVLIDQFFGGL